MPRGSKAGRGRRNGSNADKRLRRVVGGNQPTLKTINLVRGVVGQGSCAVFNVTASVENIGTASSAAPVNICIPANPLRNISQSGAMTGFVITQQSDMTSVAQLYDEFRLDGLSIHFQPTILSAVSANVRAAILADYDSEPSAGLFANIKTAMEYENSVFINPNEEAVFAFIPNKKGKAFLPWYSTTNTSTQMGGVAMAVWHTTAGLGIGNVIVKWRIIARGNVF